MSLELDPKRQEQAKIYARIQRRLMLVDMVLGAAYLIAWLVFGWSADLKAALEPLLPNPWLLVAGYGVIFGGIFALVNLPLTYYEGFVLPHRFGLSTQSLKDWV